MVALRLTGFLCTTLGAVALEVQSPHVALVQSSHKNATQLTKVESAKTESHAAIQPSLAPTSHKKFFGKDYPDDLRPTIDSAPKWSYPYPKVQSDAKYDVDYVKDENNDGGHWKAQMDYDEIKMKYIKQQAIVREAALREGMEKDEAMKAAKVKDEVWLRKNVADAEAAKAAEESSAASTELDYASKEEQKKEWEAAQKAGKSKEVFNAEQKVKAAEMHLKDCEKAVQDAKAELANAQAADAAKQQADHESKQANVAAAKGKQAEKGETAKTKQAALSDKQAKAAAAGKEADTAKAAADKEENDDQVAIRSLATEQAKLERLASDLEDAENRLRKFRGEEPLPKKHGADFHAEATHSGAKQLSVSLVLAAVALMAATA